jgi:hypothetical protein
MAARLTVAAKAYYEWPEGGKRIRERRLVLKGVLERMAAERTALHECGVMATLDVVIEKELVGMRAQANFVDLARPLEA